MKFLRNLLLGTTIVASTLLPGKLNAQIHPSNYNPFKTPNITNTERGAYGSGDVDQDGDINWNDYSAMDIIQNDQADIDGDGFPSTGNDKKELADYLNGTTPYLRGQWNKLQTREERVDWVDRLLAIDGISLDEIPANPPCWMSAHYGVETQIKYFGWQKAYTEDNDLQPIYSSDENGKFNLPVFNASHSYPGFGHGFNAVLVGDNPLIFEDWQFIEPQGDETYHLLNRGANWNPPKGSTFEIGNAIDFIDPIEMDCGTLYGGNVENIIGFKLNEDTGEPEVTYHNPNLVLTRPTVAIEDNRNTNVSDGYMLNQNYPNPFNSNTTIKFDIPPNPPFEREIPMQSREGYSINIYDINGKIIEEIPLSITTSSSYSINWNSSENPSGIYFYQLVVDNQIVAAKKMLLLR